MRDVLFEQGLEFPCGGRGRCRRCRVRVAEGELKASERDVRILGREATDAGWRLACDARAEGNVTLELEQFQSVILGDDSPLTWTPRAGWGVAVDLGTTTLVAQLLDLEHGCVMGTETALNPQGRQGSDLMSRVGYAVTDPEGTLTRLIRERVGEMIGRLCARAGVEPETICVAGNAVMQYLFAGRDVRPFGAYPFDPPELGGSTLRGAELGWRGLEDCTVRLLPLLGGFIGGDLTAGIFARGLHRSERLQVLVDLGTNAEIIAGNREGLLCASTAAGPAFEGARIQMGMRAEPGAIYQVRREGTALRCQTIGHATPRGICGSGLVDAIAAGLDAGLILPSGRITDRSFEIALAAPVVLHQCDIRELQLAKGAISAGIEILLEMLGARTGDVETVHLCGAFGNCIVPESARRIGMLNFAPERVTPAGNTSLHGAKQILLAGDAGFAECEAIRAMTAHVALNAHAGFMELYAEQMGFPACAATEAAGPAGSLAAHVHL